MSIDTSPRSGRGLRAALHHAFADEARLAIVDALRTTDLTPGALAARVGLGTNLLSHHLEVLEGAGVVARRRSDGDRRRRYVKLLVDDPLVSTPARLPAGRVLFVCTRNAARSQLARALWEAAGGVASSAGAEPAPRIDPLAQRAARAEGLALPSAAPRSYDDVHEPVDLVVSVCDRALERGLPFDAPSRHWSVADPAGGDLAAYRAAARELRGRVQRLAGTAG